MTGNFQFRLAARPIGRPKQSDRTTTNESVGSAKDGEIIVRIIYLSLDRAMRDWMDEGKSYIRPVALHEIMRAIGIGKVIASRSEKFSVGDYIAGELGVQKFWKGLADDKTAAFYKVDPELAPLPKFLNVLGMTAYFGLLDGSQPKAGETVVVSGAAGAVGQTVGQVAKQKGCRVVGIAGGKDKCDFVINELGFDACIDYKNDSVKDGLKSIVQMARIFILIMLAKKFWTLY